MSDLLEYRRRVAGLVRLVRESGTHGARVYAFSPRGGSDYMEELTGELEALLAETGRQHHAAFLDLDGADPDWANSYADYLVDRLPGMIETGPTRDELASLPERLGEEQPRVAPEEPWSRYYARFFVERYA